MSREKDVALALPTAPIDELHLAITPTLLGRGERLFTELDMVRLGYKCVEHVASAQATHVVLAR